MESSVSKNDAQLSFRSPPRRRRSTFFEKRDSIVPPTMEENKDLNSFKTTNELDEKHKQELLRYYDKLFMEKNQWKTEVNARRNKYHDLRQQYELAAKAPSGSRISYSALSNEDIEFLKGKVNISQLVESQSKLHKSVKETKELYRRAMELDNVLLNHCEKTVNRITDHILENSSAEIAD